MFPAPQIVFTEAPRYPWAANSAKANSRICSLLFWFFSFCFMGSPPHLLESIADGGGKVHQNIDPVVCLGAISADSGFWFCPYWRQSDSPEIQKRHSSVLTNPISGRTGHKSAYILFLPRFCSEGIPGSLSRLVISGFA